MAAASGATTYPVTGPYFTKYSDDHWDTAAQQVPSAVMFKDKEYPSASAALEAYIQNHEGRPSNLFHMEGVATNRSMEPVEELLTPQVSSTRAGYVDKLQAQRLKALKQMVDEAYERLEAQTTGRGLGDRPYVAGGHHQASMANQTLTESQRVLACISPLPGVTSSVSEGTVSTGALLKTHPQPYIGVGSENVKKTMNSTGKRGYKTMQDYVEEARRAGAIDLTASAGALTQQENRSIDHANLQLQYDSQGLYEVVGSTARPTVLSIPPLRRQYANGGRSPPQWVKELNGSKVSPAHNGHSPRTASKPKMDLYSGLQIRGNADYSPFTGLKWSKSKDDLYLLGEGKSHDFGIKTLSPSERVSLTTDDLVYATPDGRNLSAAKLQSLMSSPGVLDKYKLSSERQHQFSSSKHPSDERLTEQIGSKMLSSMRRDFAKRLLQEVEEGPSSIITGHLGEGGAMHAYESPILPSQKPYTKVNFPNEYSPSKLKTLGLLTPETERLLKFPPRPGPMPGYVPSPVLPHMSSSEGASSKSNSDTPPAESHDQQAQDLSVDFTERVRALLLAPPLVDQGSCSPGEVSESQQTDDILDGDREWERQPSYKPPKYVSEDLSYGLRLDSSKDKKANIVDSFLKECLDETDKEQTLSGPHQPGSMEALKNMLFKVQSMVPPPGDQSLDQTADSDASKEVENREVVEESEGSDRSLGQQPKAQEMQGDPVTLTTSQKSLSAYQHLVVGSESFEEQPGADSLQKAMEHLSKLKTLVKEPK